MRSTAVSGNAMASMLLGYASGGGVDNLVNPFYQWVYFAPWAQDDIKLGRKLTVNLGLRWDVTMRVTERYNRMNRGFFADTVNPISQKVDQARFPGFKVYGGIGFAGVDGQPRAPFDGDYNNWQPRAGAAYQLNSNTGNQCR